MDIERDLADLVSSTNTHKFGIDKFQSLFVLRKFSILCLTQNTRVVPKSNDFEKKVSLDKRTPIAT